MGSQIATLQGKRRIKKYKNFWRVRASYAKRVPAGNVGLHVRLAVAPMTVMLCVARGAQAHLPNRTPGPCPLIPAPLHSPGGGAGRLPRADAGAGGPAPGGAHLRLDLHPGQRQEAHCLRAHLRLIRCVRGRRCSHPINVRGCNARPAGNGCLRACAHSHGHTSHASPWVACLSRRCRSTWRRVAVFKQRRRRIHPLLAANLSAPACLLGPHSGAYCPTYASAADAPACCLSAAHAPCHKHP